MKKKIRKRLLLFSVFSAVIISATAAAYAGEVVVEFDGDAASMKETIKENGDKLVEYRSMGNQKVAIIESSSKQAAAVKEYNKEKNVEAAEADVALKAMGVTNDPLSGKQTYLSKIHYKYSKLSYKTKVAVLDSGINVSTDLKGAVIKNIDETRMNLRCVDLADHGTSVASVIGARTGNKTGMAGIGNNCSIINICIADRQGNASVGTLTKGIIDAVNSGAKVICISYGGNCQLPVIKKALIYARTKGVTVVCAAGNSAMYRSVYPARYANELNNVISVMSCNAKNRKSYFSNYGDATLSAYGENIVAISNTGRYMLYTGTSYSAPIVAGVAAQMYGAKPKIKPSQVKSILCKTATDTYTKGKDIYSGYGIVNASAAVDKVYTESAVKGLKATSRKLTKKTKRVTVTWSKKKGAVGYRIYSSTNGKSFSRVGTVSKTKNKYIFKTSVNMKYARVRAYS